jgi:Zn-dependent protease with chaperone function
VSLIGIVRLTWPALFLVPLGLFAGKYCWLDFVDPAYHSLLWLHQHMLTVVATLGALSIAAAVHRFARSQLGLRRLRRFAAEPPDRVARVFSAANLQWTYIQSDRSFCFTTFEGPTVFISSKLALELSEEQLAMVVDHERLHIVRKDPLRALLWHLFFAALIVPGFQGIEEALHRARETRVDELVGSSLHLHSEYASLRASLAQHKEQMRRASIITPSAIVTACVSLFLLGVVGLSQVWFSVTMPYLMLHHC